MRDSARVAALCAALITLTVLTIRCTYEANINKEGAIYHDTEADYE